MTSKLKLLETWPKEAIVEEFKKIIDEPSFKNEDFHHLSYKAIHNAYIRLEFKSLDFDRFIKRHYDDEFKQKLRSIFNVSKSKQQKS